MAHAAGSERKPAATRRGHVVIIPDSWKFLTAGNAAPRGGVLGVARAHGARGRLEAKCDTRDGSNSDGFW
jgi:hypothetical protein